MKKLLNRFANKIEGHFSIGNLTVFGDNAMHFGCTYYTKKYGYLCFRLPIPCGISDKILYKDKIYWKPLYFYVSRNGTPQASVFMIGKKGREKDWALTRIRKFYFGWNYNSDSDRDYRKLREINELR